MAVTIRQATREELSAIVTLLVDDGLARQRESTGGVDDAYETAFNAIDADPNHMLLVGIDEGAVVSTLQLSFLPNLTYHGGWRAQIEGVRVSRERRGEGEGIRLVEEAIRLSAERGCVLVQLTSDKSRSGALDFYRDLGFEASHEGFKLRLGNPDPTAPSSR